MSIKYIDEVVEFDSDLELSSLLEKRKPDIMVVGSDWQGKNVIGSKFSKELKFFERIDGYSTTKILEHPAYR